MTHSMVTIPAGAILAIMLASGAVVAQDESGSWDANTDGGVDLTEFETGTRDAGLFSNLDADADDSLSEQEIEAGFGEGNYSTWDQDGDGEIRESEFLSGLYNTYDLDASGSLDESEFGTFREERLPTM